ncbi:MAG TPA: hypothetical protein VIL48_14865 [Acidimicrobiales bacterium]
MKNLNLGRVLLGIVGLAIGIVGVIALREATLSTHEKVDARQTELVVSAQTRGGETNQTLAEMVEAQLLACRLEVTSDIVGPIEDLGSGRFRAVFEPAMDDTNRRQFRGCVTDWLIDHVRLGVVSLEEVGEADDHEDEADDESDDVDDRGERDDAAEDETD